MINRQNNAQWISEKLQPLKYWVGGLQRKIVVPDQADIDLRCDHLRRHIAPVNRGERDLGRWAALAVHADCDRGKIGSCSRKNAQAYLGHARAKATQL